MKILNSILYFFLAFGALILITGAVFKILHLAIRPFTGGGLLQIGLLILGVTSVFLIISLLIHAINKKQKNYSEK